jgi:hypothetical protein
VILDDINTKLKAVVPTLGTIIVGYMPDDPNKVLVVHEYSGIPAEHGFGTPGVKYETPGVQLIARGEVEEEDEPYRRLYRAYLEMMKIQAVTINGTNYLFCSHQSGPMKLRIDDERRAEFVVNFLLRKEPSVP